MYLKETFLYLRMTTDYGTVCSATQFAAQFSNTLFSRDHFNKVEHVYHFIFDSAEIIGRRLRAEKCINLMQISSYQSRKDGRDNCVPVRFLGKS